MLTVAKHATPTRRIKSKDDAPRWHRAVRDVIDNSPFPARRLWATVLWTAVEDMQRPTWSLAYNKARQWLEERDADDLASFREVCTQLDLDDRTVRRDLLGG